MINVRTHNSETIFKFKFNINLSTLNTGAVAISFSAYLKEKMATKNVSIIIFFQKYVASLYFILSNHHN